MQTPCSSATAIRVDPANPDHHLWNNNGTWFVHYTIHPSPILKERRRESLRTKCRFEARRLRDKIFEGLAHGGAT